MKKTIIIAEGGVNHNGKISLAKKNYFKGKRKVGADYIKFQMYDADALSTSKANKADYQKKFNKNETQKEMLKKYQMSSNQILDLRNLQGKKIKFMLSVFDDVSVNNIRDLKLDYIKIPSGEIDNFPMLAEVTKINSHIIISTGDV